MMRHCPNTCGCARFPVSDLSRVAAERRALCGLGAASGALPTEVASLRRICAIGGRHSIGERLAATLGRYAADLSSIVIEHSGHFVPEEAPDAFCEALGRFLAA